MAESVTIIQLCAKQEELQDVIAYLEGKLTEARADLLHVSAVLRLFETNGEVQQFPAHVNLSRMFSAGELSALATKALTEKGGSMTTRELGAYVIKSRAGIRLTRSWAGASLTSSST